MDPVKHGLASRPTDWLPSSIHRDIRLGRVAPEWTGDLAEGRFGEAA
jgi:putative transposase